MTIEEKAKKYDELFADCPSNTINDFYPEQIDLIKWALNLYETKVLDVLYVGKLYTKTRITECMGFAYKYVLSKAKGWKEEKEK